MKIAKDGIRSIVKVGYDGRVHKTFRGTDKEARFANEVKVLRVLEARGCEIVPRLLDSDPETLTIVTTNCGAPAEKTITEGRAAELFELLEAEYGILHDDPYPRNITYNPRLGQFCIIDFELAKILDDPSLSSGEVEEPKACRMLEWGGFTKKGFRRETNQDALAVFSSDLGWGTCCDLVGEQSIDDNGLIFAVSDGMGGLPAGDLASTLVVRELRRFLPAMMGGFHSAVDLEGLLEKAVESLHEYITRMGDRNIKLKGMGATLVCGLFYRSRMTFAHVGDSRLYRYRRGILEQLTYDHTYVGAQFRSGKLKEREARVHPRRNMLQQAIGGTCQFARPQVSSISIERDDWYLICSDGVVDGMWNKNLEECFNDAEASGQGAAEVAQRILDWAVAEAGGDDTTLFVIRAKCGEIEGSVGGEDESGEEE